MAYNAATARPRKVAELGFYSPLGAAQELTNGSGLWLYVSSDASKQIGAVTGYFANEGAQPSSNPGQGVLGHQGVGMRGGDIVLCAQSSAGVAPGLVTLHMVVNSTFSQGSTSLASAFSTAAGFNVTVS